MSEETEKKTPNPIATEMVFCGIRLGTGNKPKYAWAEVNEPELVGTYSKNLVNASIGNIYQIFKDGDSAYTSGKFLPRYLRQFDNKELISQWIIKAEAAKSIIEVDKMNKKSLGNNTPIDNLLRDINSISIGLNSQEKRAFLAMLVEAVRLK